MKGSKIEWTDHTFNPWEGCEKVSEGCKHCYAETRNRRFVKGQTHAPNWGKGAPRRLTRDDNWKGPVRWNKEAKARRFVECDVCGKREARATDGIGLACCSNPECMALPETESHPVRPRVFCASLADVFDAAVPTEWRQRLLQLIDDTPHLDWLLLTKRPQNIAPLMDEAMHGNFNPVLTFAEHMPNVWLGTTVENQAMANERLPFLQSIEAKVRFLSCEPLLSEVDLTEWLAPSLYAGIAHHHRTGHAGGGFGLNYDCNVCGFERAEDEKVIHWLIAGGESGPGARPMNPDWARSLRKQCKAASVPFFFKQWGEWIRDAEIQHKHGTKESKIVDYGDGDPTNFRRMYRVGKLHTGRLLDGEEHNGFPTGGKSV